MSLALGLPSPNTTLVRVLCRSQRVQVADCVSTFSNGILLLRTWVEGLPVYTPVEYILAAIGMSLVAGLISGVGPARRAASLEPVEALRTE